MNAPEFPLTITLSTEDAELVAMNAARSSESCHGVPHGEPLCEACKVRIADLQDLMDRILDAFTEGDTSVTVQVTKDNVGAVLAHAATGYLPDPMDALRAQAAFQVIAEAVGKAIGVFPEGEGR